MNAALKAAKAAGVAACKAGLRSVAKTGMTPGGHQRILRCGAIATKLGMSRMWDKNGSTHPLTLLQISNCQVMQVKTPEIDGYSALQVGAIDKIVRRCLKSELNHVAQYGVPPKREVQEFRVTPEAVLEPGTEITAAHFKVGQFVDVTGTSIGKGYQGPMKRWGFAGQGATHGVSRAHRSLGSTGNRKTPGRTWPGKKMAGRMGGDRTTVLGLKVVQIDVANNLVVVRGSVPGSDNAVIRVRDAIRMHQHKHNETLDLPVPTVTAEQLASTPKVQWVDGDSFKNPFTPNP